VARALKFFKDPHQVYFAAVLNLSGTLEICQNRKFLANQQLQQKKKASDLQWMSSFVVSMGSIWVMERWRKTKISVEY
jgi:hypothetical protein